MSLSDYTHTLTQAVSELSDKHSYEGLFHQYKDGDPLPSGKSLRRIVELSREILFPGYFGNSTVHRRTINYHIGVNVEELFGLLTEQIQAGLCFGLENTPSDNVIKKIPDRDTAASIAARFILFWRNHLLLSYYPCNYQLSHCTRTVYAECSAYSPHHYRNGSFGNRN